MKTYPLQVEYLHPHCQTHFLLILKHSWLPFLDKEEQPEKYDNDKTKHTLKKIDHNWYSVWAPEVLFYIYCANMDDKLLCFPLLNYIRMLYIYISKIGLISHCFSKILSKYGSISIVGELLDYLGNCAALTNVPFKQGVVFLLVHVHLLWHRGSVFAVSFKGSPQLVARWCRGL